MAKRSSKYARYSLFFVAIVFVVAAGWTFDKRKNGVLACQPSALEAENYLAYCQIAGFGDYDHGAFWFDLEEGAASASVAEMLIIGNSRIPFAFSAPATTDWVENNNVSHYVLGFTHKENVSFFKPLLSKLDPDPKVAVINADDFFVDAVTDPASQAFADGGRRTYVTKKVEMSIHRSICNSVINICGRAYTIYRTQPNGHWRTFGDSVAESAAVVYDVEPPAQPIDEAIVNTATEFVEMLGAEKACVIFTHVPSADSKYEFARALAERVGVRFVAPKIDGLSMFDGSHLDDESGQIWSEQFFREANDVILNCVGRES